MKMLLFVFFLLVVLGAVSAEDSQTFGLKFLRDYGYISSSRSGNHDVGAAIRKFQEYFGLPVSGVLDGKTVALMHKPRCGVPDVDGENRIRRYNLRGKWSKKHLTFYIQHGQDLDHALQNQIFTDALNYWAAVSGLSFSRSNDPNSADIKISFGRYSHAGVPGESSCPYPFNGPGGVLAHAYFPQDGRAHFDEDETYTHGTSSGVNLLWVAVHEFGHSLGLEHSNVRDAVMYPYYTGFVPDMKLHSDDIAGIQAHYGPNTTPTDAATDAPTDAPVAPTTGCSGPNTGGATDAPVAPTTSSGDCFDRTDCAPYDDDYCQQYPESMKYWCAKTCSFC